MKNWCAYFSFVKNWYRFLSFVGEGGGCEELVPIPLPLTCMKNGYQFLLHVKNGYQFVLHVKNWYQFFTHEKYWCQFLTHEKNCYQYFTHVRNRYQILTHVKNLNCLRLPIFRSLAAIVSEKLTITLFPIEKAKLQNHLVWK